MKPVETLASIRLTLQYETSIIPTSYTLSLKPMTPWDPPKEDPTNTNAPEIMGCHTWQSP